MRSSAIGIWETAVKDIIQADSFFVNDATIQAPRDYFRPCMYNRKKTTTNMSTNNFQQTEMFPSQYHYVQQMQFGAQRHWKKKINVR